ncbi:ankyrin [Ophiobolus disseminans]|uniref:Ankyrin n=1 Tax=Ophiobolus disseminans TaxID=1469910 RepID=A0A6A6ZCN4_9PLEO|nr:ankyrin [Ophiobolus disseminans]
MGHDRTVYHLLQHGAYVESYNKQIKNRRALHEAILGKHAEAVKILLQAGADITKPDAHGDSVLDYAGSTDSVEVAQALLQSSRTDSNPNEMVSQLARSATNTGSRRLLEWLLSTYPSIVPYSKKPSESLLFVATSRGHRDVLELLLSASKTKNYSDPVFIRAVSRCLPFAARRENLAMVKMLLQCESINVDETNIDGGAALHLAVLEGYGQIVDLLLSHPNVKINEISKHYQCHGQTALHIAATKGHRKIVELLLHHQDINKRAKDYYGRTPMATAFLHLRWNALELFVEHEDIDTKVKFKVPEGQLSNVDPDQVWLIAKYLLERGDLSITSRNLNDWLEIIVEMVRSGWIKLARFLIKQPEFDVNFDIQTVRKIKTILHVAAQCHQHEIFSLFLGHPKIDANRYHPMGPICSVLHCAVQYDNMTAVKLLLARKELNLKSRDWEKKTALDLAIKLERYEMAEVISKRSGVKLLVKHHAQNADIYAYGFLDEDMDANTTNNEYEGEDMEFENLVK